MIIGVAGACGGTPLVPRILAQPQAASFGVSTTATLSVVAAGVSIVYQWYKGATLLSGKTSSTLSIPNCQESDGGSYSVVVSNANGTVTSSSAVLTVLNAVPEITVQPQGATLFEGQFFSLDVTASVSTGTLSYQWQRSADGNAGWSSMDLTGTSHSIQSETTQFYRCRVTSNFSGLITYSSVVEISVTPVFVTQPSSAGFSATVANLAMSCEVYAAVGVASYTPQRLNSGSWADVLTYSENLTNGLSGGTQTTTDQSVTISTINPPEAYIANATYRIKVGLQAGGFTFSKPITFSNVIRPGSISIQAPARYTGSVFLNQSFPAGIRAAWYYQVDSGAWQSGLVEVDAVAGIPNLAIPMYNPTAVYGLKAVVGFSDSDLLGAGTNTIESASVPVLPAIEITSQPQDVTKLPLQAFVLAVVTQSADNQANLTYSWTDGTTVYGTERTLSVTPYSAGYTAPLGGGSSAEGDSWCVNGASLHCVISDTFGNSLQSRTVQITVSGTLVPVITSGFVRDVYISSGPFNLLETFNLAATSPNAPVGRRDTYATEEGADSYLLSDYPLGKSWQKETDGTDRTFQVDFFNAFGEVDGGAFVAHFGSTPSARGINTFSTTPGGNWYPADGFAQDSSGIIQVHIGQQIYLQSMGASTGTGNETFTWFGKFLGTFDQYVPIAATGMPSSLPGSSTDTIDSTSYNYFIILVDQNPFTLKLVNTNSWGSSYSEVTFQAS